MLGHEELVSIVTVYTIGILARTIVITRNAMLLDAHELHALTALHPTDHR
jgi:hypothetical protein